MRSRSFWWSPSDSRRLVTRRRWYIETRRSHSIASASEAMGSGAASAGSRIGWWLARYVRIPSHGFAAAGVSTSGDSFISDPSKGRILLRSRDPSSAGLVEGLADLARQALDGEG